MNAPNNQPNRGKQTEYNHAVFSQKYSEHFAWIFQPIIAMLSTLPYSGIKSTK